MRFCLFALLAGAHAAPADEPVCITLIATGDVIPHGSLRAIAKRLGTRDPVEGWRSFFARVAPIIAQADVAFANLETPIAPASGPTPRPFIFDAPPALAQAMKHVGFDVVALANNHAMDQGISGLKETVDEVMTAGLLGVGLGIGCDATWSPQITVHSGVRIAWLAATMVLNGPAPAAPQTADPCLAVWDREKMASALQRARSSADFIVVSMHWGGEYQTTPHPSQVKAAKWLAAQGVDLILGHHPHVLQPVRWIEGAHGHRTLVAYSLGNAVSNQGWRVAVGQASASDSEVRMGLLLRLRLRRAASDAPVIIEVVEGIPIWTSSSAQRILDPAAQIYMARLSVLMAHADAQAQPWWQARWQQVNARLGIPLR